MAKQTKRTRKFVAKGGAKAMIEKGTITKKGKLRSGKRRSSDKPRTDGREKENLRAAAQEEEKQQERNGIDFAGTKNLGDLDMDDFFKTAANLSDDGEGADEAMEDDENDDMSNEEDDSASGDDAGTVDEEEDVETAERRMKAEMDKLEKSDPEFHKYLKENESQLLEFGDDDEEDEDGVGSNGEVGGNDEEVKGTKMAKAESSTVQANSESPRILLNAKRLASYEKSAFHAHGVKGLRRIVGAYRSACHMADPVDQNEDKEGRLVEEKRGAHHIDSSMIFDRLVVVCLKQCHEEFYYHLLRDALPWKPKKHAGVDDDEDENDNTLASKDENTPINPLRLSKSSFWVPLKSIIQVFFKATLHLLSEAKEANLLTFVLKSLSKYVPYLTAYPRLVKNFLKTFVSLWSTTNDTSLDYQVVRLNAFIRIRQLALTQPFPFIELCLKATYLAYAKRAKFATAATVSSLLPTLTFMGNCVVEIYSLDYSSSYQHAFVYIRQLALHLRTALQKKTPETFRAVYCWQYVHCLKLWSAVLSSACQSTSTKEEDEETHLLRSLIYPLTEIIVGVARLIPTTRHLPLRLHCVRLMQQLAASAEIFIPTTSILLDVFDLKELYMKPKRVETRGTDVRGVRLPLILKLPKDDTLRTAEQLDACLGEVFVLLNREVDLYRYSPGFPEFCIRICQRLRTFSKETKSGRFRAYSKGCIEQCEKYSKVAIKARLLLEDAPKDIKRLEALKPTNVDSMRARYEAAVGKEKRLEVVSQPALSEAGKSKVMTAREKIPNKVEKVTAKKEITPKADYVQGRRERAVWNKVNLVNVGALEEADKVQEGVHWSDDEGSERSRSMNDLD